MSEKVLDEKVAVFNFVGLLKALEGDDPSVAEQIKAAVTEALRLATSFTNPGSLLRIEVLNAFRDEWEPDNLVSFSNNLNGHFGLVLKNHGWYWLYSPKWRLVEDPNNAREMSERLTVESLLLAIRDRGWAVAVHNDYKQNGKPMTFWLFTHPSGKYAKGEGDTDIEALRAVWLQPAVHGALPPPEVFSASAPLTLEGIMAALPKTREVIAAWNKRLGADASVFDIELFRAAYGDRCDAVREALATEQLARGRKTP
jgi:hypothetical protein